MLLYTLCKILKRNKIQCPDISMCVGELPSVNDALFSWPKRSHLIIKPPLFRAGFAIPEGAPLSGDHLIPKMFLPLKSENWVIIYVLSAVSYQFH